MSSEQPFSTTIFAVNGVPLAVEAVEAQLARVLASESFQASRRLTDFLKFVVEETLDGRSDRLKEYAIAVNAMERPADFDPQIDPAVRIQAGRLRTALERYFHEEGARDPIRITIPKGGYVPDFRLNEAIESEAENGLSKAPGTGASVGQEQVSSPTLGPTVAVVTFFNLSQVDGEDELALGFSESLVAQLFDFGGIHIIGPIVPAADGTQSLDLSRLGRRYGAQFVLHGSTRRHGDTIRVTAILVDPVTRETIWTKSFRRRLGYRLNL